MRQWIATVFDDFVYGTATVYTSSLQESLLGRPQQLAIQALAENVAGSSVQLTVSIQTSSDGRFWIDKSGIPQINRAGLATGQTTACIGVDDGSTPSGCLVRFAISLGGSGPSCALKIVVCGRGSGEIDAGKNDPGCQGGCGGEKWTPGGEHVERLANWGLRNHARRQIPVRVQASGGSPPPPPPPPSGVACRPECQPLLDYIAVVKQHLADDKTGLANAPLDEKDLWHLQIGEDVQELADAQAAYDACCNKKDKAGETIDVQGGQLTLVAHQNVVISNKGAGISKTILPPMTMKFAQKGGSTFTLYGLPDPKPVHVILFQHPLNITSVTLYFSGTSAGSGKLDRATGEMWIEFDTQVTLVPQNDANMPPQVGPSSQAAYLTMNTSPDGSPLAPSFGFLKILAMEASTIDDISPGSLAFFHLQLRASIRLIGFTPSPLLP